MKIGKNITQVRESKGYSAQFVADGINMKLEDYLKIEQDILDITLNQLNHLAAILSCSPIYLLEYKESGGSIYNHFDNAGNNGTNIQIQGVDQKEIRTAYKELYREELERIPKLERLLRDHNIEFDI
ncbi:hypothetical protein APR41_16070 [Salegentibacter salinarum]|uniref:Uncharacterized protein n=1 Tax=Salegentibacter salinarum TaxID=447422 RepID=A0A2N0TXQ8_9FLAO|nr:helix-turn-helix transcriptional regulator [Salegentibacter salinarum]PKD19476.1 hypothetical protein APR41_16070 [Salegentibacter salinarum]SKB91742.1 hypothetical protein SAMN05660903_03249 [Salegentibacter salinarum]